MPANIIIQAPDTPLAISGKIVELAARNLIHHKPVSNTEALANPESLEFYRNLSELDIK
jgi:acetoacetyl-CoA synthetase